MYQLYSKCLLHHQTKRFLFVECAARLHPSNLLHHSLPRRKFLFSKLRITFIQAGQHGIWKATPGHEAVAISHRLLLSFFERPGAYFGSCIRQHYNAVKLEIYLRKRSHRFRAELLPHAKIDLLSSNLCNPLHKRVCHISGYF